MSCEDPEALYRVLEGLRRDELTATVREVRLRVRAKLLSEDDAKVIIWRQKPWPFTRAAWGADVTNMPITEQWRVGLNGVERALEAMLTDERGHLRLPPATTIAAERLIYRVLHPKEP